MALPSIHRLFFLPRTGIRSEEGLTDNAPIVLHGHSSADFDCLLDHLFGKLQDTQSEADTKRVNDTPESVSTRKLVSLLIESLGTIGIAKIPAHILHALIQLEHQIFTHRFTLAAVVPPAMTEMLCHTQLTCADAWETGWRAGPAEMLRHPYIFYSGQDILAQLESIEIPQVCADCQKFSVANVKETGCLLMEDGFVDEKLEELRAWLVSH